MYIFILLLNKNVLEVFRPTGSLRKLKFLLFMFTKDGSSEVRYNERSRFF